MSTLFAQPQFPRGLPNEPGEQDKDRWWRFSRKVCSWPARFAYGDYHEARRYYERDFPPTWRFDVLDLADLACEDLDELDEVGVILSRELCEEGL